MRTLFYTRFLARQARISRGWAPLPKRSEHHSLHEIGDLLPLRGIARRLNFSDRVGVAKGRPSRVAALHFRTGVAEFHDRAVIAERVAGAEFGNRGEDSFQVRALQGGLF